MFQILVGVPDGNCVPFMMAIIYYETDLLGLSGFLIKEKVYYQIDILIKNV